MKKDNIYQKKMDKISSFEFNEDVVNVFDDMVTRSVPFYNEIHRIILDIIDQFFITTKVDLKNEFIYDLGCSTGTTIALINDFLLQKKLSSNYIGVDNSPHMVKKCKEKLAQHKVKNFKIFCNNIEDIKWERSRMVLMNYTLQFIPVKKRLHLVSNIYQSLKKNGVFVFTEKIKSSNDDINNLLTNLYFEFKMRNGYSKLEISQKREALENVLIPLAPSTQISLLKNAGFTKVETIFRWYNFACFIGIK